MGCAWRLPVNAAGHRTTGMKLRYSIIDAVKLLVALVFIAAIILLTLWRAGLIDLA